MPLSVLSTRKIRRKGGFRRTIGSELFVHGAGVGSSLRGGFFGAFFFILGNVPKMGTCSLTVVPEVDTLLYYQIFGSYQDSKGQIVSSRALGSQKAQVMYKPID